jgi:hypothetical protein
VLFKSSTKNPGTVKKRKKAHHFKQAMKPQPAFSWQTGNFKKQARFKFLLPFQFLLLCKLMDITPDALLSDFMDNLSCGSWKREGREKAKEKLIEYFIEHGYGRQYYSVSDIHSIFKEMDAIGMLFPKDAEPELLDKHSEWRELYHAYWFDKWYYKFNRG